MKLILRLSFLAQRSLGGQHGGYHHGIPSLDHAGFSPIITTSNPTVVPTTSYEYLFYLPTSDQLWPPARRKAQGLLSRSSTLSTAGHQIWPKILDTTDSLQ
jgi:hypothetical protein